MGHSWNGMMDQYATNYPWFGSDDAWNEIALRLFADAGNVADIAHRYDDTKDVARQIWAVPAEQRIMSHIAVPLRAAWVDYLIGNYLGTIALCGAIGEMIAILVYASHISENSSQTKLVKKFCQKGQLRRLQLLVCDGAKHTPTKKQQNMHEDRQEFGLHGHVLLEKGVYRALRDIHRTRIRYYHEWGIDPTEIPQDAKRLYSETVHAVSKTIGQELRNGKLRLNQKLMSYLRTHGCVGRSQGLAQLPHNM